MVVWHTCMPYSASLVVYRSIQYSSTVVHGTWFPVGSQSKHQNETKSETNMVFAPVLFLRNKLRPELELELIQTQMAQKPMLRAEVGMRVRCANKASAE